MALSVSQANTVSRTIYGKDFMENVYDSIPLLKMLREKHQVKKRGGDSIQWPIEYKEYGTANRGDWDAQVIYQAIDTWTAATLDWVHVDANVAITKEQRFKNAGEHQIVDLVKAREKALRADLSEKLADMICASSTTTGDVTALSTIVDSADTYGGIAVADASVWAGNEDSTTTQMTRSFLYGQVAGAEFADGGPSVHFTTRALKASYNALLGADERYHNTRTANAGFKTITLMGENVYAEPHLPANYWFGLDLNAFEFWCLEGVDGKPTDWFELEQAGHPKALAKYVDIACNLVAQRRRTSFKCSALTGT